MRPYTALPPRLRRLRPHPSRLHRRLPTRRQPPTPASPRMPGDLLFYGTPHNIHHVGIRTGNGHMISAPSPANSSAKNATATQATTTSAPPDPGHTPVYLRKGISFSVSCHQLVPLGPGFTSMAVFRERTTLPSVRFQLVSRSCQRPPKSLGLPRVDSFSG
ncbi:NlpC/P60 family protein [Streptomyces profundus]|uniref:NlpC/P60 family protein n=1 Tax=Streptomyces profundus TaxID=2867410 RepID=UPI001D16A0A9|nr:C40 family peptidase [Streptomyces sp. MA3_2.13]